VKNFSDILEKEKEFILFYSSFPSSEQPQVILFYNPIKQIICKNFADIEDKLKVLDFYINKGYYIAGFISYEAGLFFNDLKINKSIKFPLFSFGIYKKPVIIRNLKLDIKNDFAVYDIKRNIDFKEYKLKIKIIRDLLKNGEVYQINYCFKEKFRAFGDLLNLFFNLVNLQKTKYSAFIKSRENYILSISPEMFFFIKGDEIIMKPMKGTLLKDGNIKKEKLKDEKNKAENIMIVDLIRNDLGKICRINSIEVPEKFVIEDYGTLYQMTSTIKGKLKTKKFSDIIKAIFPSGSVTGAPKRRAMQFISILEKEPRRVYTGSIGYFSKNRGLFNICIRTAVVDRKNNRAEMGIGSGVVYDSVASKEYRECLGKAKFLEKFAFDFKIFESILYEKGKGFFLLNEHLKRLKISCKKFRFKFNKSEVLKKLNSIKEKIKDENKYKIRIFIDANGNMNGDYEKIRDEKEKTVKLMLADEKVNSKNIFLYHKTTKRQFYDNWLKEAKQNGFDEVVFLNERGQITECATSNIFIEKNGIFFTPPVKCGLLNGTYRQHLLLSNPQKFREKILYKKDLLKAKEIFICNSVRAKRKAVIENRKLKFPLPFGCPLPISIKKQVYR